MLTIPMQKGGSELPPARSQLRADENPPTEQAIANRRRPSCEMTLGNISAESKDQNVHGLKSKSVASVDKSAI